MSQNLSLSFQIYLERTPPNYQFWCLMGGTSHLLHLLNLQEGTLGHMKCSHLNPLLHSSLQIKINLGPGPVLLVPSLLYRSTKSWFLETSCAQCAMKLLPPCMSLIDIYQHLPNRVSSHWIDPPWFTLTRLSALRFPFVMWIVLGGFFVLEPQ